MKKLNIKKVGLTLSLVSAISVCSVFTALADWKQNDTGWWYEEENGSYIKNDWKLINDKWYFFGEDGYLYTNRTTPDGYKVDNNGEITEKLTERKTEKTTEIETTVAETTPEVTESPTTTVPETTTVAPTETSTMVTETTPKTTEWQPTGSWNNESEAKAIGAEIQNNKGLSQNPIRILDNSASFGDSTPVIKLTKTGDGYEFAIKTKLLGSSAEGFRALCMLIDGSVYSDIMNDYSNEVFTPDTWTSYGSHQYYVHVESGLITYKVK